MSTIVKGMVVGVTLLCSSAALARQNPNDLGEMDSAFIEVSQFYEGAACQIPVDVYFFNDADTVIGASILISWDHPGLEYDSVSGTALADSAFDEILSISKSTAQANHYAALGAVALTKLGLTPAPEMRKVGSIWFHLNDWQPGDSIHFDTTSMTYIRLEFATNTGTTYPVAWRGMVSIELTECNPTAVEPPSSRETLPDDYALAQNYPNPFNPSTAVDYSLPTASTVELAVFNQLGQRVATLADGLQAAGDHRVYWDGRDDDGDPVASGVYLYRLTAGDFTQSRKMLLLK